MVEKIRKIFVDFRINLKDVVNVFFYIYVLLGHFVNHTLIFQIFSIIFMVFELLYMMKRKKLYISHYLVFYLLFIIYCILLNNTGISVDLESSNDKIKTLWIDLIINIFVVNYLFIDDAFENFPKVYSQTGFIYCVYMLLFDPNSFGKGRLGGNTPILFGLEGRQYQANMVGFIFAYAFNMYMYRIMVKKERKCIFAAAVCAIGALLTGSRKALLIVLLGMFFLLYCFYEGKNKIKIIIIAASSVAIMYVIVMNVPAFYDTVGARFDALVEGSKTGKMEEGSAVVREHLIDMAKMYHEEKPKYGYGIDNFRTLEGTYGLYAHNNFYEVLVDVGNVGFCIFYISYLIGFILLFRVYISKDKLGILCFVEMVVFVVMEYGMITYYERPMQLVLIFCIVKGTDGMKKIIAKKEEKKLISSGSVE